MIRAEGAGYSAGRVRLLAEVSLHLRPGTLTAVLGRNGAGKTTLLRLLTGELAPESGRVMWGDAPIASLSTVALARRRAVLSQQHALSFGLAVADVVALGRLPHRGTAAAAEDRAALATVREDFMLEALWERPYPTLSGGERQRAQLARAAAQLWRPGGRQGGAGPGSDRQGQALFLDEPAAALDLAQQGAALRFAADMARQGAAVLAVLHDPNHAVRADQVVLLRGGRVLAAGSPAEVLTAAQLGDCLGVTLHALSGPGGQTVFLAA
jgi:iron complex transport system ATP-binding protein